MAFSRGLRIDKVEYMSVDPTATNVLPLGGFVEGDPIKMTSEIEGNVPAVNTDLITGILLDDVVFPYTKKELRVAIAGDVAVTVSGAYPINSYMALDPANPRRFVAFTPNTAGTVYRQVCGRLLTATTQAGDKAILRLEFEMMT